MGTDSIAVFIGESITNMNNITAAAYGATNNYGLFNYDSSSNARNSTAATNGLNSYGIYNGDAVLSISNVTATAWGTGTGYSLYQDTSHGPPSLINADRSTFEGNTDSAYIYFGAGANVLMGGSKLIGPVVTSDSTLTCAHSYNGDYIELGPNCQ